MAKVYGVGNWSDDPRIREAMMESDKLRRETLKRCYKIPGYARLTLVEKNKIYDEIREQLKNK